MNNISRDEWKAFLASQSRDYSLLQDAEWGDLKAEFGWTPDYVRVGDAGAMVLFRKLPLGLTIGYIPRGPVGSDFAALWPAVHALCKKHHAVFLRVEPDFWQDTPEAEALRATMTGFRPAFATVQPPRTIVIPLEDSEDEWLARMNQKTRYNIRLSQKKDLVCRETMDAETFHSLMAQTGERDAFGVHSTEYYARCLAHFGPLGAVRILQAEYGGQPIAALMLFIRGKRGYYLYGASSNAERNRMPNHFLQWRAMQICREQGCESYDLWGIPDEDEETLESLFQERHDGLWQVYRFKRGFGGKVLRTMGAFDYVYQPLLYETLKFADAQRRKKRS